MKLASYRAVAQIGPGAGLAARTATALLYVPNANDVKSRDLVAAFLTAASGDELNALSEHLVDNDFGAPAFSAIGFESQVQVMVFGDAQVTTDNRALPLLSGVGSQSWVKNDVWGDPESIELSVGSGETVAGTDLGLGVVTAGAVVVSLAKRQSRSGRGAEPLAGFAGVPRAVDEPPAGAIEGPAVEEPAVGPVEPPAAMPPTAEASGAAEPNEILDQLGLPSDVAPPFPGDSQPSAGQSQDVDDNTPALDATFLPDVKAAAVRVATDVLDEQMVGAGEGPDSTEVSGWGLAVFDDGSAEVLDSSMMLGRNPTSDTDPSRSGHRPVELTGEKLSRIHAEIIVSDMGVMVADCGSTNGTVVVPAVDLDPIKLTPGVPVAVQVGAVVYLGSRTFRFDPLPS